MFGSPCSGVFQEPKSREHNLAPSTADTRKKPRPTAHNYGRGSITMHPQGQIQPDTAPNSTQPTLRAHNLAPSTADTGKKPRPTAHNHGRGSTNLHPRPQIQAKSRAQQHTTTAEGAQTCTLDRRYTQKAAPTRHTTTVEGAQSCTLDGRYTQKAASNSTQLRPREHNHAPSRADTTGHRAQQHTTTAEGAQTCTLDHRYITAFAPTSQRTQKPRERKRGAHGASVIREPTAGDQSWKPL